MIENSFSSTEFSDIPSEYTSSIGATVWPPIEASFERKKGVYPEVLESTQDLNGFLANFNSLPFDNSSRISCRAIVNRGAFENIGLINPELSFLIETIIPLAGCGETRLEDCCLVYFGKNNKTRVSPPEIVLEQLNLAKEIFTNEKEGHNQRLSSSSCINIFLLNHQQLTEDIVNQYFRLYSPFGWSREQIEEMLNSANNILIYAQKEEQIISSVLGEKGEIQVRRNHQNIPLSLVEITEAATLPEYRGQGIYGTISNALLFHLARLSSPPHLVYGELNLDSPGVLKVAARQGRIPAWWTAKKFGLPHAWILPQHVTINQEDVKNNQRPDNYLYNNLMVVFLPRQLLLNNYGQTTNN